MAAVLLLCVWRYVVFSLLAILLCRCELFQFLPTERWLRFCALCLVFCFVFTVLCCEWFSYFIYHAQSEMGAVFGLDLK